MKFLYLILTSLCYPVFAEQPVTLPAMVVNSTPPTLSESRMLFGATVLKQDTSTTKSFTTGLGEEADVSPQTTGVQQTSPFIHGFTSYRNDLLVDGIRLNNAINRDGPNQYWSTIDPYTVDETSLYFGQSAMIYGSDAFGSAVNVQTRKRSDYTKEGFNWDGRANYRYGSAEASNIGRMEFEGNYGKKIGFLLGTSIKDYGDIRGGEKTGMQPNTGYSEQDADARIDYNLTDKSSLTFVHQNYNAYDAPRTHSTTLSNTLFGNSGGKFLYRNYTQSRELDYVKFNTYASPFFDQFSTTASYQRVTEDQRRQRVGAGAFNQGFTDNIGGFNVQAKNNRTRVGDLTYGLDYYHDFINSYGTQYNLDGSFNSNAVQGPVANHSSYDNLGIYFSDDLHLIRNKVVLSMTTRYSYAKATSGDIEDASSVTGASSGVNTSWSSFTNGGRLSVVLDEANHYKTFVGINQGWRAPTIFDLTGDELARSSDVQVPTLSLGPEKFVTYESGIGFEDKKFSANAIYYYTKLDNVIARYATGNTLEGNAEVKGQNAGQGFIQGITLKADCRLLDTVRTSAGLSWTEGHLTEFNPSTNSWPLNPYSRINPLTIVTSATWDITPKIFVSGNARFVSAQGRLSARDISDTQRIPPKGSLGYSLYGVRAGWKASKDITLTGAVENLTNSDYRVLGSGVNGLGRNIVISADYRF